MRLDEFDFRIWDNKLTTFVEAEYDYLGIAKKDNHHNSERILDIAENCSGHTIFGYYNYTDNRFTIELCTGLVDKNGKKIYVGDILKWNDDFNRLQFLQVEYSILYGVKFISDDVLIDSGFDIVDEMEIVGNIHENKDLIGE